MDRALLEKMHVYPSSSTEAGLIEVEETGESTLIKADVSIFHAPPPPSVPVTKMTDAVVLSDYDLGVQDGKAHANALHVKTIGVMEQALDTLLVEMKAVILQIERSHLDAVGKCLRVVFPALMSEGTDAELRQILKNACESDLNGKIQIAIHPDAESHCRKLCGSQDIEIVCDDTLSRGQTSVKWNGGGADIDCESASVLCLAALSKSLNQLQEPIHG